MRMTLIVALLFVLGVVGMGGTVYTLFAYWNWFVVPVYGFHPLDPTLIIAAVVLIRAFVNAPVPSGDMAAKVEQAFYGALVWVPVLAVGYALHRFPISF